MAKLSETAALVSEVVSDTKVLFELQLKLLRAEIRELSNLSKELILMGALALAALVPALLFLGLTLSEALMTYTSLERWTCNLIVFGLFFIAGVTPLLRAKKLLEERREQA